MRPLVIALVALFAFSVVPPATEAQSLHSLAGTVCVQEERYYIMEGDDTRYCGRGVPGATVAAALAAAPDVPVQTVTTSEKGAFSFTNLAEGDYIVTVTRTGFARLSETATVPGEDLTLIPDPQQVTQRGTVTSTDGKGLEARVWTCCADPFETRTNASGGFTLDLPAGWYSFHAEADHHIRAARDAFVDGAGVIDLRLDPTPPPEAYVTGTVRDQDGRPVAGATVEAWSYAAEPRPMPVDAQDMPASELEPAPDERMMSPSYGGSNRTTSAADGSYRLGVFGGHVSLSAYKEGHASTWTSLDVQAGETATQELDLLRYPEKTARIEGKVTGPEPRYVSISIESPLYGIYECSHGPENGGTGDAGGTGDGVSGASTASGPGRPGATAVDMRYSHEEGCTIQVAADGTFTGAVTPGYTIVRVHYNEWMACDRSQGSDCGPGYMPFVQTMDLAADATTRLDVTLRARPTPDSTVSGYLVDDAADTAIPGGQVSFSRIDGGGYGWASTDQDGSYRIRLTAGTYEVSAWADGYLAWAGIVEVDGQESLDILMREGRGTSHHPMPLAETISSDHGEAPTLRAATATGGANDSAAGEGRSSDFEDLGGGLGPYDADRRQVQEDQGSDAPAAFAVLVVGLIGAVLLARRK